MALEAETEYELLIRIVGKLGPASLGHLTTQLDPVWVSH